MIWSLDHLTPEEFFSVPSEVGLPINVIHCLIARAEAVVLLLHEQSKEPTIANALWAVDGDLQMLRAVIDSAHQAARQAAASARDVTLDTADDTEVQS